MAQKTLAATPAVRYPDPLVRRVNPDGTQPYTAYQAPLVYSSAPGTYQILLTAPPDFLAAELLLFGADYPAKICGTQQFETTVYDSAGAAVLIQDLSFPLVPSPSTALVDALPSIIPSLTFDQYKKIATGATATNAVTVSGFPAITLISSRNLFLDDTTTDRASYAVQLDVTLNGGVVDGPAPYVAYATSAVDARIPVILWEGDLTQAIVDANYIIDGVTIDNTLSTSFDVVGIWASSNYTPPGPRLFRAFAEEAPRESILTKAPALYRTALGRE